MRLLDAINAKWFIFSDGEPTTIIDLRRTLKKLKKVETLPELSEYPNIFVLDNSNNFETYLLEQGYSEEIINAINQVEDVDIEDTAIPFFDYFIEKHHGESLSPRSTGIRCESCGQTIKEKPLRDYKSDGGQQRALKDCMKAGKAKYAPVIAKVICEICQSERQYPTKIKSLLDCIKEQLEV